MGLIRKIDLEGLKRQICTGDEQAIRILTQYFFPELWANMLAGKFDEQVDALINLEFDLKNNSEDFCKSKDTVENYLRKQWKTKLAGLRKKTINFDDAFMGAKKTEAADESTSKSKISVSFQYQYFFNALDPITRMLFETKYFQGLSGRNGLFQVTHFLLNANAIAHDKLQSLLASQPSLQEPLISNFLIETSKNVFTNQKSEKRQTIYDLLNNLPGNKKILKQAFHSYEMKLFRMHNCFKELLIQIKQLSLIEQTFVLINQYLPIEHVVELWVRINIDSQINHTLKQELKVTGLSNNGIKQWYGSKRAKAIIKTLKLGKQFLEDLNIQISRIQNSINKKLIKPIVWKTR